MARIDEQASFVALKAKSFKEVLRGTLANKQCNMNLDIGILRDRLLRVALTVDDKYEHLVP